MPDELGEFRLLLRAELAELELRLKNWIREELDRKANADVVDRLSSEMTTLSRAALTREGPLMTRMLGYEEAWTRFERGELTPAQRGAIDEVVDSTLAGSAQRTWTARERRLLVIGAVVGVLSLIVALVFNILAASP